MYTWVSRMQLHTVIYKIYLYFGKATLIIAHLPTNRRCLFIKQTEPWSWQSQLEPKKWCKKDSRKRIPKKRYFFFKLFGTLLVPELATSWKGQEVSGIGLSLWVETPPFLYHRGLLHWELRLPLKQWCLGRRRQVLRSRSGLGKTTAGIKTMSWWGVADLFSSVGGWILSIFWFNHPRSLHKPEGNHTKLL